MMAYIFAIFLSSVIVLDVTNCNVEVLKSNGTAGKDLDAQTLVSYGRKFNDSLITMIGRVIENYHECVAWSEWTECGATLADFYTTRTRTRRCGYRGGRYAYREETEVSVCEGRDENKTEESCPVKYHTTTKGLCLKLYTGSNKRSYPDAEAVCKNDGGFLVNIDSDQKYESVVAILKANDIKTQIYIDGKRLNSKWKFSYGSLVGYFLWHDGYPKSNTEYNCLKLNGSKNDPANAFRTFNSICNFADNFVCEIPVDN